MAAKVLPVEVAAAAPATQEIPVAPGARLAQTAWFHRVAPQVA
jgi:hypothetical protein